MNPNHDHIMQFFTFEHLPPELRAVSQPFAELAARVQSALPRNPERTVALRKLLEAKDAAVRAQLSGVAPISGGSDSKPKATVAELAEDLAELTARVDALEAAPQGANRLDDGTPDLGARVAAIETRLTELTTRRRPDTPAPQAP